MRGGQRMDDPEHKAFQSKILTVEKDVLLWGMRVIVPKTLQERVLRELHTGHPGIVRMKALARSYCWWPGIDGDLETKVKACSGCQETQKQPQSAPLHPWEYPEGPWQRIHIDYAGPFLGYMFLVVVDAYSKWPAIFKTKKATSDKTIEILRSLFAAEGVPEVLASDNGPQFVSEEMKFFLESNGIQHARSAPYHPSTNGLAERMVQSFKYSMKAAGEETATIQKKLDNFLLTYRNTEHATTGRTPAEVLKGRRLRTRLDLMKPDLRREMRWKMQKQVDNGNQSMGRLEGLKSNQSVLARNYNGKTKWIPGVICNQTGPRGFVVQCGDLTLRRHADQLVCAPPPSPCSTPTAKTSTKRGDKSLLKNQMGNSEKNLNRIPFPSPNQARPEQVPNSSLGGNKPALRQENSPGDTPTSTTPITARCSGRIRKPVVRLDL